MKILLNILKLNKMEKEKVVVAMSNDPGSSSVCKNLGAEISIGRIQINN